MSVSTPEPRWTTDYVRSLGWTVSSVAVNYPENDWTTVEVKLSKPMHDDIYVEARLGNQDVESFVHELTEAHFAPSGCLSVFDDELLPPISCLQQAP